MMRDSLGRRIAKLRISVTDRCDLRCTYCMPAEGLKWMPRPKLLTFEEITRLTRIFASLGIEELRLTGGEPLVRAELPKLVGMLADTPGILDIAMTTNGIRLDQFAQPLREAGLHRVNVSLDTLDRSRFHQLTRRDAFDKVIAGLGAALQVFPGRVKVNAVAMRGVTEHEIGPFIGLARDRGLIVRFIEFMPLDADGAWTRDDVLTGHEIRELIEDRYPLVPDQQNRHAPANRYRFTDAPGAVGFIDSVSAPFCEQCDRIRMTADGKLRTCLFSVCETDLRTPLREGADDEVLAELIEAAVWEKEPGHRINQFDFEPASRSMSQIGG